MSEKAQDDLGLTSEERNSIITRFEHELDALHGQLEGKTTGSCDHSFFHNAVESLLVVLAWLQKSYC